METGVENDAGTAGSALSTLEIRLIGEVAVRRGGETVALPPSRKCRALLAYLAAQPRPQRREHLCTLFWEVPDDPRGSLRWSLSKLRRTVGDVLIADRETVSISHASAQIDSVALLAAASDPKRVATAEIERVVGDGADGFGDDLDLPKCPDFQVWLLAAREDVRQARLALLRELAKRLEADPERALPFARLRVVIDPLDEHARQALVETLAGGGRADEAELQRRLAVDVLKEAGIHVPDALVRPVRAAAAARPSAIPAERFQKIQFCTAPDGVRIACSAAGSGPPIVKTANWMSHLEFEWESPILRHWIAALSEDHTLIRYDARGNGLSDRCAEDLSFRAFIGDVETVADALAGDRFDLIGISQGAPVAIAFAALHPERVRKLVLFGGFAMGWRHHHSANVHARWEAMITLTAVGWGKDNPAFRQMFTSQFLPRATSEQANWFNELQRVSASPEESQRLQRAIGMFDARELLSKVRAPTIVFHCRGDAMVPYGNGRFLAANIPGAEFVGLDSDNHLPLEGEPAFVEFIERLRAFLDRPE